MIRGSDGKLYPKPNDYLSKTEEQISSGATGIEQAAGDVWNVVKHAVQHPIDAGVGILTSGGLIGAAKDLHQKVQEAIPVIQAYDQARSQGKGVWDSLSAASDEAKRQQEAHDVLKQRIEDFKKTRHRLLLARSRCCGTSGSDVGRR